jgi:hypothetical protein
VLLEHGVQVGDGVPLDGTLTEANLTLGVEGLMERELREQRVRLLTNRPAMGECTYKTIMLMITCLLILVLIVRCFVFLIYCF